MKVFIFFFVMNIIVYAQSPVFGEVLDEDYNGIENVNIYIKDSYDGTSSEHDGSFSFETELTGMQTLVLEKSKYEIQEITITLPLDSKLEVILSIAPELDEILFIAGSMKAKGNTNEVLLSALDVVTTANALGDTFGALQTLPGVATVENDGRLYIRGGESNESGVFIDGLRVFQPYNATVANTSTRGRYSPMLFKGLNLNTGGYNANYGQALSGILELETEDFNSEDQLDLQFTTVGFGAAFNKAWEKDGLTFSGFYNNLTPYNAIFTTRDEWLRSPEAFQAQTVYRHLFDKGILKSFFSADGSRFKVKQQNINYSDGLLFDLGNLNYYTNNTYTHNFNKKWNGMIGFALSQNDTDVTIDINPYKSEELGVDAKGEINWNINPKNELTLGAEYTHLGRKDTDETLHQTVSLDENIWAGYLQYTWQFIRKFGLKVGLRTENSSWIQKNNLSPRASLAYKLNPYHNFSLFYGQYFQSPYNEFLYSQPQDFATSQQWLLNYFFKKDKQIIRVEIYQKEYDNLVRNIDFEYLQNGNGYARGIDLFMKNTGSHIKNLKYWLSYSYIDTKRLYLDFPTEAQPSFIANHNLSISGNYWWSSLRSQIGFSYVFNSGRPYNNPNSDIFMDSTTRDYNNFSFNWAYLIDPQKILYFSVNNVFNTRNISGYNFSNIPNAEGVYESQAITASLNQFFFIGFFWTISTDKNRNQLDAL